MRIGILSDTHDQRARTAQAVSLLIAQGADVLIHCGDLTSPEVVYECAGLPSHFVFGNNDFDQEELRRAMTVVGGTCLELGGTLTLDGRRIAVTHGDSVARIRRLAAEGPDFLLFGHTHVPSDYREGPTRYINPGALHRAPRWTVAMLDLATDEVRFFDDFRQQRIATDR